jgi:hypothetical protein
MPIAERIGLRSFEICGIELPPSNPYSLDFVIGLNRVQRRMTQQHKIGTLADCDCSDFIFEVEGRRIDKGSGLEDLPETHSGGCQTLHLKVAIESRQVPRVGPEGVSVPKKETARRARRGT